MPDIKIIDIEWSERLKIAYDKVEERYILPFDASLDESGLYQIYGRHPIYGPDVLLYIGETKESEVSGRSFRHRLLEHVGKRFWYHVNLSVALGSPSVSPLSIEIQIAESILIAAHTPALNRKHLDTAKEESVGYLVRNWGFIGSLMHECSGEYWRQ